MMRPLTVSAPSRLHFGLWAFAPQRDQPGYGGVGLMIDQPRLRLRFEYAESLTIAGPHASRIEATVQQCAAAWSVEPCVAVSVLNSPPHHSGLGLGTQLALSVVRGWARLLDRRDLSAAELTRLTGRGGRSAVGTYGNLSGGLIVDGGKSATDELGTLAQRLDFPSDWAIVLARPPSGAGVSGDLEREAFQQLPAVPVTTTRQLKDLSAGLVDACRQHRFDDFATVVGAYGRLAGSCFATWQGSEFASPAIAQLVDQMTQCGATGAGQSSWGPTVFGFCQSHADAQLVVQRLAQLTSAEILVTHADNRGLRYDSDAALH